MLVKVFGQWQTLNRISTGGPEVDGWPPSWPRTHSSHHSCRLPKVFSLLHHCDNDDKDDVFLCAVLIRAVMMCHKESSLWAPHWKLDEPQSWSSEPFNHARTRRGSPLEGEQRKFTTNCFSHQLSQTPLPLNTDESCMPHAFFLATPDLLLGYEPPS